MKQLHVNRSRESDCHNNRSHRTDADGEEAKEKGEAMLQRGGARQDQVEDLNLFSEGEWGNMQSSVEELKSLVELLGDETAGWSRRVILEEAVSRLVDLELQLGVRPNGTRQAS